MTPIGEHPFGGGQTVRQGCGSGVVADLACGHEELQRTTLRDTTASRMWDLVAHHLQLRKCWMILTCSPFCRRSEVSSVQGLVIC
jgi:hypothetical protein